MYSIKITYSWGDEEEPYGEYATKEAAYKEALLLAAKEAYVQNEEFEEGRSVLITADASIYSVTLVYEYDGEVCNYGVVSC